jgi:hypothetical protein
VWKKSHNRKPSPTDREIMFITLKKRPKQNQIYCFQKAETNITHTPNKTHFYFRFYFLATDEEIARQYTSLRMKKKEKITHQSPVQM